ncbi:MAG: flotillin family protein [Acidobacteriota bacterium]
MWWYRKVEQGRALVLTRPGNISVSFTPRVVWPLLYKVEEMDISLKTIEIDRRGTEGLICRDNIRADIKVAFFVRVNKNAEDVIRVAQAIGCKRASDPNTLEQLFSAKFSEALKTVGKQLDFVDLYTKREEFRDQIIGVIGRDLNGYFLEDAAIDYLEQTPMEALDNYNILDAQGIRKITELTATEHVKTNEYENFEKKQIKKQNVEAQEAILELERQQADAEAKQEREIATVRAREEAEIAKVQSEERLKAENARIRSDEEIQINEENRLRQVEVAAKNKERVIAVETERVEKDRLVEVIARERETELQRIAKEKEVEVEKKAIADVIRERVAVDRTVAEEEERIKELRIVEEANRSKKSTIITAEAEAQEGLVKDIKAAEAQEEAAKFDARRRLILADAELEAADKEAQAKIRLAEGVQAEAAAEGLAEVRIKEQDASAIEKQGRAEATVLREQGSAEASAIQEKLVAEAAGIEKKAVAMAALDEATRGHEEFRLRLEKERAIESEAIEAQRSVAEAQARVLAKALEEANIDIVGGDGEFLDKLTNSIAMGKSVDGFVGKSGTMQTVLGDYLTGKANLPEDLKELLSGQGGTDSAQNIALFTLLAKMMRDQGMSAEQLGKLLQSPPSSGGPSGSQG